MAITTTYNVQGNREDLTDFLTILEPEDTPKLSTFAKVGGQTNKFKEWQVDNLANVDFSGVVEGQDVQAYNNESVNRAEIGNYVQKFRRPWMVSDLQEASNPAGVSSEVAESKSKAMREIKRSIESAIGSDNEMQQDNGSIPYLFRGLGKWIQATAQSINPVPAIALTPSASIDTTATASLTESAFNDVFQSIFQVNGGRRSYTLFAGPSLKRAISNFQRATSTSNTTNTYRVTQDATENRIDLNVTVYEGDFHTVTVVPDMFNGLLTGAAVTAPTNQQKARGYVIDPSLVGISYMIGMQSVENPNLGGGRRGFVHSALTLMVKNPKGLGKFAGSS
jgi:hypothetical protein